MRFSSVIKGGRLRHLDPLESRTLLTFIGFRDGNTLAIDGTAGDDQITIDVAPDPTKIRIQINGDPPVDISRTSAHSSHNVHAMNISSAAGNDVIHLNGPTDLSSVIDLNGGPGDDLIVTVPDRSQCLGEEGNDTILASGNDGIYLEGGGGKDVLTHTGSGAAIVLGGSGNDLITTAGGNDTVWGGPGSDTISTGTGDDVVMGGRGNDSIDGGAGNDYLFGQQGNDIINGGDDDDHLFGQDGNDVVSGDAGADTLFGGAGNDTLKAGELTHWREYRGFDQLFKELVNFSVN